MLAPSGDSGCWRAVVAFPPGRPDATLRPWLVDPGWSRLAAAAAR